ncbi:hypothetical protein [Streptomyces sp. MBT84]|uniref:hypothetical protein n=1 Tax=Streptomyces sp. MBT84 TaxID=1488414 RepID=UPI001C6F057B|nr:hypothetical protein [Streptomyces sp. MBT84]
MSSPVELAEGAAQGFRAVQAAPDGGLGGAGTSNTTSGLPVAVSQRRSVMYRLSPSIFRVTSFRMIG